MAIGKLKGIVHIGAGVLLLSLLVVYILIYLGSPSTATQINTGLHGLATSVKP